MNEVKKEVEQLLEKYNGRVASVAPSLRSNPILKEQIVALTQFLPDKANTSQRMYHIINDLYALPTCKGCGNNTSFWNFYDGYRIFCKNVKCSGNDPTVKNKREETCVEIHGETNIFKTEKFKKNLKQYNQDNFAVDHVSQRSDVREKTENTNIKNCGQKTNLHTSEFNKQTKITNNLKYDSDHYMSSTIGKKECAEKTLKRCGYKSTLQTPEVIAKGKETLLKKLGVDHQMKSPITLEKYRKTSQENHGTDHPMQAVGPKTKKEATCERVYKASSPLGNTDIHATTVESRSKNFHQSLLSSDRLKGLVVPLFSEEEYKGVYESYKWQCIKCGNTFEAKIHEGKTPRCKICFPITSSSYELEIREWLESFGILVETSNRIILKPMEIDLYLPDHKLAIEFNGLYWHGESVSKYKCNQAYHLKKTKLCEKQDITLLHIFEDEWIDKKEVVKSIILNKLGLVTHRLYARKCEVKEIDFATLTEFLESNHLQGPSDSSKYKYGLFHEKELVYTISLSKPRFTKKYEYELIRSCGKVNTSIIGGFNKLINHAIRDLDISSIISYVDRRYFNGSGYKDWEHTEASRPNYFYVDTSKIQRESRLKFQKKSIKKNFPDVYDERLTEWQLMQLLGYDRIWDCGHLIFEWRK